MTRASATLLLAIMLAVPTATVLIDLLPSGEGTTDIQPLADGRDPVPDAFWSPGGTLDVIVTFTGPCVVERRLALEGQGITDAAWLAALSRDHKALVEEQHGSFLRYVAEGDVEVTVNQEYTTVLNGLALTASSAALDRISRYPTVETIERDTVVSVSLANSVPLINADDLWGTTNASGLAIRGQGIVVAVLDTGIDYSHPDLGGTGDPTNDLANVTSGTHDRILGGWNIITDTADFWDGHFHGTHCAGIVGANGSVVGVAPEVDFLIYKVLSDGGSGPTSGVIAGVELATDPDEDGDTTDHADVISMSLGGFGHPDDAKCEAVDNSMDAGVVVAVAAVNDGPDYETIGSPGCARKVISVGATSKSDLLASFSSVGPTAIYQIKPDLTGPGVSIYSTSYYNSYRYASGTSMATPHVAGAAALLVQSHPGWSSQQVKRALMGTAKDVGYNEYRQGAGRMDVLAANDTVVLADPPSVSLGRLSAVSNVTNFTIEFQNLASTWSNGTLGWGFAWELTSLYASSGDSTDLSSMLTANTTSVNISSGGKVTVKFTLTYDQSASVGHHLGAINLTVGPDTIRVPLAFYIRSPILLVDDDNTDASSSAPYNNHNPYTSLWYQTLGSSEIIGDALSSLAIAYDVAAVRTWYDGPDGDDLGQYRVVIWNTGFDYAPYGETLTDGDLASVKDYADGGGNLWLLGSLSLYDLYGATNKTSLPTSDVMRAVFGMGGYTRYAGTPDPMDGTAGTFMAVNTYDVDTLAFGDVDYGGNLTPIDGAYQVLTGSSTDNWGYTWMNVSSGIARDSGENKTLFTAFEFPHIATTADRKDLVAEVLDWIDLRPHGAFDTSGTLEEGSNITFSGRVLDARATESYVFEWDFDYLGASFDTQATGSRVTHAYDDDGTFLVALRVRETRTGTVSPLVTSSIDVLNAVPEAHPTSSSPGEEGGLVHFFGNVTDPGTHDTFTWEWDFHYDGQTFDVESTSQNPSYTYLDDGTFTAALRVTDDGGLTSPVNTTTVVVINLPPTGNPFTPGSANEGDTVPFTATVSDPSPFDTVNVSWDFEYNGVTFTPMAYGTSVSHVYLDSGNFRAVMRLRDEDGGITNYTLVVQVLNVAPTADVVYNSPINEGGIMDFNTTVTDPGTLDTHTFEWDFDYQGGDLVVTATLQNVSWLYVQDGNYTVALRVTDDDGGSVLVTKEVTVLNVAPKAKITGKTSVNEGQNVQYVGGYEDDGKRDMITYSWDFGDGGVSVLKDPFHIFLDDGQFNVTLTVTDDAGASGSTTMVVQVRNVAPNATLAADPDHIQENGTVSFQADGRDASPLDAANLSYTWNFGDGESSNLKTVDHVYMDDGCFTVTLVVSDDDGGVATYHLEVLVENVSPGVRAQADREYIQEGEVVNFTARIDDPGPLDTHTAVWDFADGATSDQLSVAHRFLDNGNYIVRLTVMDNSGGTNTTTFRVAVSNVRPSLTASANATEIDEGDQVAFSASWTDPGEKDTHTLLWDFGDGTTSEERDPVHRFVLDGTLTVIVTVTDDDSGQASKSFVIEVRNVPPVPSISASATTINENGTVQLTGSATDKGPYDTITFHWDFGDGSDPPDRESAQVSHRYVDNGVYRVSLRAIDSDGAISSATSVLITVNNLPPKNLRASADLTITTVGKPVTFSAYAEDDSPEDQLFFLWNFGDTETSTERVVSHIYQVTSTYEVILLVSDDDGGQTIWKVNIVVKPDMDGDRIPDDEDKDRDGDGYENSEDDYPDDPSRYRNWTPVYLGLLVVVVVLVAVAAYIMRPRG